METTQTPVNIYAESTPNPAVMKFVANKMLVQGEGLEFELDDDTSTAPIAGRLLQFPFVSGVYITANFISVTKTDVVEWDDVMMQLREFIKEYIESGQPVVNESADRPQQKPEVIPPSEVEPKTELDKQIIALLDEYVKPAVESDGGNIYFQSYEDGKVNVVLQGACSGCPSSTMTLKSGIEAMLKQMLPGKVSEVVAIEG